MTNQRIGSCILPQFEEVEKIESPQVKNMDSISPERVQAMIKRAKELKTKFPHMKTTRIKRKVAEEFKIKLV